MEGTGLEKEQIVHIQVACKAGKAAESFEERKGLYALVTGCEEDRPSAAALLSALRVDICPLKSFGWRVIFGEDFKKPA